MAEKIWPTERAEKYFQMKKNHMSENSMNFTLTVEG